MEMAVLLRLEGVLPKVGEEAESVGAVLPTYLHGYTSSFALFRPRIAAD